MTSSPSSSSPSKYTVIVYLPGGAIHSARANRWTIAFNDVLEIRTDNGYEYFRGMPFMIKENEPYGER